MAASRLQITTTRVARILTRTGGYLSGVTSHSLQPYRGCPLGASLCGVGCYVQHNPFVVRQRPWGSFLEARENAAESYLETVAAERRWAQRKGLELGVFLSSSTEPFPPQERRFGVTRSLLEAMCAQPPDVLILQTHSHRVAEFRDLCGTLAGRCRLRLHISIESDRDRLPGLPPAASSVDARLAAARTLRDLGLDTVITVAPLLPIMDPEAFFERVARCADAVVIDHFIQGDGSTGGQRTLKTSLPAAMAELDPGSVHLDYRDRMVEVAREFLPVGVGVDGFAGRYESGG